jgi:Nif-specific regulatory protein
MKELIPEVSYQSFEPESAQKERGIIRLIIDISYAVNRSLNLENTLHSFLETLTKQTEMNRGTITLVNSATGVIELELISGFPLEERSGQRRHLGETIIDKVIESGQTAVLLASSLKPHSIEQALKNLKTSGHKNNPISYTCVPLRNHKGEILGALGIGRIFPTAADPRDEVQLSKDLGGILAQVIETHRKAQERDRLLREERNRLRRQIPEYFKPETLVGNSHAFRNIYSMIKQAAPSKAPILITGESGTGKELIAETIHNHSLRAGKPFIRANLEALPENLIETELFGAGQSPLAGELTPYKGLFEIACGGTLYLDEVGHLPIPLQAKLFNVLKEKEYRNPEEADESDVRIISATSRNLEELVKHSQFRMDLYYRLNLLPIHVPPLRERKSDIPLLANHFAVRAGKKHGKLIGSISSCAMDMLMHYSWPGNIQEMESYIDQAALQASDGIIYGYHLPPTLHVLPIGEAIPQKSLKDSLAFLERRMIEDVLSSAKGNIMIAAQALGISERLIRQRLAKYQIDSKDFR